jgi:iron complex transport system ATP-binding protein
MLEARDVTLRRGGRLALSGVSLSLAPGELVAVCGPNGAGKSSLLGVLAGDLRPDAGQVALFGRPLAAHDAAALATRRAVLEQDPDLAAPFTVAELVALGAGLAPPGADAAAIALDAMEAAGVAALSRRRADLLSGGERARAHLARVLAQLAAGRAQGGGHCLLLDEPTASLDLAHQVAVMESARRAAAEGAGVLAVLHDLTLAAAFADRVALMADGRLVAEGPSEAVFEAARLSRVYGAAIAVDRRADGALRIAPDLAPRAAARRPPSVPPAGDSRCSSP